jgi:hypothetical protein
MHMSNAKAPVNVADIVTVADFLEASDAEQREIMSRASYAKHADRPATRYRVALDLMKRVAIAEHQATADVGGRDASVYGRFMPGSY